MRKISIKSQQSDAILHHDSDARTLGELKAELEGKVRFKETRCVIKGTKQTLEFDDSILPEEEFVMFIFPQKSKGGEQDYSDMTHNELRKECKSRPELISEKGNYGNTELMIKKLELHDEKYAKVSEADLQEEAEAQTGDEKVSIKELKSWEQVKTKKLKEVAIILSKRATALRDDLDVVLGVLSYIEDPDNHESINDEFEELSERINPC